MDIKIWDKLDKEIKKMIHKNGLTPEMIKEPVSGELNEISIKTSFGYETLFYGNGEASITVEVDGQDYNFCYVIDSYGDKNYIVNF